MRIQLDESRRQAYLNANGQLRPESVDYLKECITSASGGEMIVYSISVKPDETHAEYIEIECSLSKKDIQGCKSYMNTKRAWQ